MKDLWISLFLVLAALPASARAEHALIDLRVSRLDEKTGKTSDDVSASADREPPAGGHNPRSCFQAKPGEPLVLQFVLTNDYPHGEKKDVTVRYLVVQEEQLGQRARPSLDHGVVTQGKFRLNFKPRCRVGARAMFTLPAPGAYLLRVETENTDSDHEHFAAIDLRAP
jgi:hypothetical protein